MREQSATQRGETGTFVKLVPAQALLDHMKELSDIVARRAFEIFERRGGEHGRDLDDWLVAESEIVHACRYEVRESGEAMILRAEVPGSFTTEQLKISVEPRRLMVSGKTELNVLCGDSEGTHSERKPRHIFRVHDLPIDVDPARTTATLKDEVLKIVMPKIAAAVKPDDKAKATSPGR